MSLKNVYDSQSSKPQVNATVLVQFAGQLKLVIMFYLS